MKGGLGTRINKLWSEKITVPGDWGSGTPARTVLDPKRAARRAGGVSHEAQKKGRAGAEGGGHWAQEKNQKAKFNCDPG